MFFSTGLWIMCLIIFSQMYVKIRPEHLYSSFYNKKPLRLILKREIIYKKGGSMLLNKFYKPGDLVECALDKKEFTIKEISANKAILQKKDDQTVITVGASGFELFYRTCKKS